MKLRHKRDLYLKTREVQRGQGGEKYATYAEQAVKISATVYSGSGVIKESRPGIQQQYQKKLLYDEPYVVTSEKGVETFWFKDKSFHMAAGDGICLYVSGDQEPDYRIISIIPVGHLKIVLEKL